MKNKFEHLRLQIESMAVFSNIKNDPMVRQLRILLSALADGDKPSTTVNIYTNMIEELYPVSCDMGEYVRILMSRDDNFYVKAMAEGTRIDPKIQRAVDNEVSVLQNIAMLDCKEIQKAMGYDDFLPSWENGHVDIGHEFAEKMHNICKTGYGIFAQYNFFRLENGHIVPVGHPDYQSLNQLFGYERERDLIIKNTEALVEGRASNNMLLYGDAGTGKSSTIKAVAAHFAPQGLRIVEVKKTQLYQIPGIMEELSSNPLKFIIYIDDLSFNGNDDNFAALKATLEGSISGTGNNVAIYATSNRRHLIKESFADRAGDDLHLNDAMQETMSLAARFGLTITFQKPGKDEYLEIVAALAKEYGIEMPEEELFMRAEAHAIRKNGRSPRTAKQFIEMLKIGL